MCEASRRALVDKKGHEAVSIRDGGADEPEIGTDLEEDPRRYPITRSIAEVLVADERSWSPSRSAPFTPS